MRIVSENLPLRHLPGVGPVRAEQLAQAGLITLDDLLSFLPLRYIDASVITPISNLQLHSIQTIHAVVDKVQRVRLRSRRDFVKVELSDGSGKLSITYFNQPYVAQQLQVGEQYAFMGKVTAYKNKITLMNPVFESLQKSESVHTGRVVPVYSQPGNLKTSWLRSLLHLVLTRLPLEVPEYLGETTLETLNLPARMWAVKHAHFPEEMKDANWARRRLAFDEIWQVLENLEAEKRRLELEEAPLKIKPGTLEKTWKAFQEALPFPLTPSQLQACLRLTTLLEKPHPTSHLIQGEVGSGKTFVATWGLVASAVAGGQALYIAPTTILANQHFATVQTVAQKLGLTVALWTNTTPPTTEEKGANILVGTHALLAHSRELNPAVVIIDEEHRFGVAQRLHYWQQVNKPHLFTMTATPIPRTLARALYGPDEVSFLELIPGKEKRITTRIFPAPKTSDHFTWLRDEVTKHQRQAFLVAPLIEPSDALGFENIQDVSSLFARVKDELPDLRSGLITGKTPAKERDKLLSAMQNGELDILVATPVIEVGIDIPQASLITIFSAERFGLAQLHQLRGRVGRAGQESWCFLVPSLGAQAGERLKAMTETLDGNTLAELDLQQRGAGEFLGTRQSGWDTLQVASWLDLELLKQVQQTWYNTPSHRKI